MTRDGVTRGRGVGWGVASWNDSEEGEGEGEGKGESGVETVLIPYESIENERGSRVAIVCILVLRLCDKCVDRYGWMDLPSGWVGVIARKATQPARAVGDRPKKREREWDEGDGSDNSNILKREREGKVRSMQVRYERMSVSETCGYEYVDMVS